MLFSECLYMYGVGKSWQASLVLDSLLAPVHTIRNTLVSLVTIRNIWNQMAPLCPIQHHLAPIGTIHHHSILICNIWHHFTSFGTNSHPLAPFHMICHDSKKFSLIHWYLVPVYCNKIVTWVERGNMNRKLLFSWVTWVVLGMVTLKNTFVPKIQRACTPRVAMVMLQLV